MNHRAITNILRPIVDEKLPPNSRQTINFRFCWKLIYNSNNFMKKWELEKKLFNFPKKKGIIGFDFSYSLISQFLEIVRNGNLGVKVRG